MRVAFAGTPDFAAQILGGLLKSQHEVGLVISQPDTPRGRGRKLAASPVAETAEEAGLLPLRPDRIGSVVEEIANHDALVVAAYGQILRTDTLYAASQGAWNVHASLLPAYRGAAPIERAIMNGENETGVSIMRMNEGLDTGPVAMKKKVRITSDMNSGELADRLAQLGAEAIVEVLSALEEDEIGLTEQDDRYATYAPKLTAEDLLVRWGDPANEVHDRVRALAPRIGARAYHPAVEGPIKILRTSIPSSDSLSISEGEAGEIQDPAEDRILVRCGVGVVAVERLQMPGGKPLEVKDFLRGRELRGSFRN